MAPTSRGAWAGSRHHQPMTSCTSRVSAPVSASNCFSDHDSLPLNRERHGKGSLLGNWIQDHGFREPSRLLVLIHRSNRKVNSKVLDFVQSGGDRGTRTPDLVVANDALSQLSYIPTRIPSILSLHWQSTLFQFGEPSSANKPSGRSTVIVPWSTSTPTTTSRSAGTSRSRRSPRSTM